MKNLYDAVAQVMSTEWKGRDAAAHRHSRAFRCRCGNHIFFRNSLCLNCSAPLGYLPERGQVLPLDPGATPGRRRVPDDAREYKRCTNRDTPVFRDAKDRENFAERLGNLLLETKPGCYGWALPLRFWALRGAEGFAHGCGQTLGDEPGGGGICRAERRGDGARTRLPALSASAGSPHELLTSLRAYPSHWS